VAALGKAWRRIVGRFRGREDSEHEQALIRVVLVAAVFAYFQMAGTVVVGFNQFRISTTLIIYESISIFYVAWIAFRPRTNVPRRILAMATDLAAVSFYMGFGGEAGTPLYPLYLWVILGNGFRYGARHLMVSAAMGVVGFAAVWATASPWKQHPLLSFGLLCGLAVVPGYAATLIRKLTEAKAQAEEASRAKSRFLAIISHELRTPLNAIIGMSDLLAGSRLEGENLDMVNTIQLSGKALLSLIDTVLDFSRIEAGKTTVTLAEVDLHRGLADLAAVFRPQAAAKGLAFSVSLGPKLPAAIRADWPHICQVLMNLLANAVKFTERGSVSLQVSRRLGERGEQIVFEVVDTGIGIPAEKLESVFDAFAQADEDVNRRYGGSGLGLAISLQLAEALGGSVAVSSKVGAGSRFRFAIPLERLARPAETPLALHVCLRSENGPLAGLVEPLVSRLSRLQIGKVPADILAAEPAAGPAVLMVDRTAAGGVADLLAAANLDGMPAITVGFAPEALSMIVALDAEASREELADALRACLFFAGGAATETPLPAMLAEHPLRILVAEDNAVNVKVIRRILEKAGHRIDVVGTGDHLLDALGEGRYDIVVADVNMPGTPLVEVVKLFRMANLDGPRLPIIALSADATAETRRACEEAGVDVYLTKPVVSAALLSTIDRLTPRQPAGLPFAGPNVADLTRHPGFTGPATSAVDWSVVDALVELGDQEMVRELTQDFLQDAEALVEVMEQAAVRGDRQRFRAECHALRSSSANVGARGIIRLCQAKAIAAHDLISEGRSFCARVREEVALYREEMTRYFEREASSAQRLR
jgi:two-component system, sensor histidine kinase RpfC